MAVRDQPEGCRETLQASGWRVLSRDCLRLRAPEDPLNRAGGPWLAGAREPALYIQPFSNRGEAEPLPASGLSSQLTHPLERVLLPWTRAKRLPPLAASGTPPNSLARSSEL